MTTSTIEVISSFHSTCLDNERDLYVYLPPSYDSSTETRYPVLYMHDGQHVFAGDQFGESWEVHKTIDRLIGEDKLREVIVVAAASITHARLLEYFHDNPGIRSVFGDGSIGERYERFFVEEVKPYVDSRYRTLPDRENTAIMGSSAGGVASYHIGFRRPDVFGMVGILSPFFVLARTEGTEFVETPLYLKFDTHPPIRVWLDMGGAEGLMTVAHARDVAEELIDNGFVPGADLAFLLDSEAGHSQKDWADRLHSPLLYFFGRIGAPRSLEVHGRTKVGLIGPATRLYPNARYDSGFETSLLRAEYKALDPAIATVDPDGTIRPKSIGTAEIEVEFEGLRKRVTLEVVPEMSEMVEVDVTVEVAAETRDEDRVYVGFEIPRIKKGLYKGTFRLPRDLIFAVNVSKGFRSNEKGNVIRRFSTSEDLDLRYKVEEWEHP
ncbi:alpha/beta hydrolase [Cohnella faecalis]|uniref:alpha/beta hydrolase n=1 Tax=Cohnella faecalis TaxID=2315694 RepID=UPI001314D162|nr:alpha/beta hydrolase-fold protein [Cohnella faecalis]